MAKEVARQTADAAEQARRKAEKESARHAAEASEQARREAVPAAQPADATERGEEETAAEAAPKVTEMTEEARVPAVGLPVYGWLTAATPPQSADDVGDWPRELLRNREEAQAGS
jgi:hypothetical protein